MSQSAERILYCHCAYAQVVPKAVKEEVLRQLTASGVAFDAVADLCEMSAKKDPALKQLAGQGNVKIAACFPRAVKWLFTAARVHCEELSLCSISRRIFAAPAIRKCRECADIPEGAAVGSFE